MRALGYQGLSSRSVSQRQSAVCAASSHSGLPMLPARWATLVHTDTTRSKWAHRAAVSSKLWSSLPT